MTKNTIYSYRLPALDLRSLTRLDGLPSTQNAWAQAYNWMHLYLGNGTGIDIEHECTGPSEQ